MKFDWTSFRSKVARRIFTLFILCALLPITALAFISFGQVTHQLNKQSQRRLHQANKAMGLSIYERLLFLDAEINMVASNLAVGTGGLSVPTEFEKDLQQRFRGIARISDAGRYAALLGHIDHPPKLTPGEKQILGYGHSLIVTRHPPDTPSRIFLSRLVDPKQPAKGLLVGEIDPAYLWGVGDHGTLPPMTELCVFDHSNILLFCSLPGAVSFPKQVLDELARDALGQFEWTHENKEYLASYWSIPLKSRFRVPKWTVVLSESKANVLAPMANFRRIFPLVVLMSLWVVLLLSTSQIRRNLVPLEKLREGTRRIAMRDFASRVTVTSGDEFEELAGSFNAMASQLGRQFNTLATIAEIDRAILSALETETIVDTVLTRMRDVFPCDGISVTLMEPDSKETAQTYTAIANQTPEPVVEVTQLTAAEIQELRDNSENLIAQADGGGPHYLAPLARRGSKSFLVLPIFLKEKLSGIIALGYADPPAHSHEDLVQARQLADQVAVALSNARLIEELDQLNWGTLIALARTIDAKSPWTAGHSERVTELALKIGRVIGLPTKELDILHRGGLLHDIGKIGIPAIVLDKPGRLTEEEVLVMREHPRKGARILEPIAAYEEVVPIVLQHHEWFDGNGYPDGLAGEEISLGGRIFAVADVFDALSSDRPYRAGLGRAEAIERIKQGTGRQFDPKVVEAFLEVMAQEERESTDQVKPSPSLRQP